MMKFGDTEYLTLLLDLRDKLKYGGYEKLGLINLDKLHIEIMFPTDFVVTGKWKQKHGHVTDYKPTGDTIEKNNLRQEGAKWMLEMINNTTKKSVKEVSDLEYWRKNCKENYATTPISVLRYISELEHNIKTNG